MAVCIKNSIATLMPLKVDTTMLRDTAELCYSQLYGEGLINDFQIRRLKFIQQAYDEQVLLWMVVAITISGVALAGVQLFVSFRLASSGKTDFDQGGEISLERNRLSLKSSVTGLFILALSFAFFIVFVYEVFKIKEINPDNTGNKLHASASQSAAPHTDSVSSVSSTSKEAVLLWTGGIGTPREEPMGESRKAPPQQPVLK